MFKKLKESNIERFWDELERCLNMGVVPDLIPLKAALHQNRALQGWILFTMIHTQVAISHPICHLIGDIVPFYP